MSIHIPGSRMPEPQAPSMAIQNTLEITKTRALDEQNIFNELPQEVLQKVFGFMHFDPSQPQSLHFVNKSLFQQMMNYAAREQRKALNFVHYLGKSLKSEFPEPAQKIEGKIFPKFESCLKNKTQSSVQSVNNSILSLKTALLNATCNIPRAKLSTIEQEFAQKAVPEHSSIAGKLPVLFGTFSKIGKLLRKLAAADFISNLQERSHHRLRIGRKIVAENDLHTARKLSKALQSNDAQILNSDIVLRYVAQDYFEEAHKLISKLPKEILCADSLAPICRQLYSRGGCSELLPVLNLLSETERSGLFVHIANIAIREGRLDELKKIEELMPPDHWHNPSLLHLLLGSFIHAKLWPNGLSFVKERVKDDLVLTIAFSYCLGTIEDGDLVREIVQAMPLQEYADLFLVRAAIDGLRKPVFENYMACISDPEVRDLMVQGRNAYIANDLISADKPIRQVLRKYDSISSQLKEKRQLMGLN